MIAHLPMYDVPANRAAHRRLWQALQDQLPDAPNFSPPSADLMDDWLSPDLYLSQTCGLPYRAALHGQVQLIATPDNHSPNCPPGYYCSVSWPVRALFQTLRPMILPWLTMSRCRNRAGPLHSRSASQAQNGCKPVGMQHLPALFWKGGLIWLLWMR